jgi:hypothetical protein
MTLKDDLKTALFCPPLDGSKCVGGKGMGKMGAGILRMGGG